MSSHLSLCDFLTLNSHLTPAMSFCILQHVLEFLKEYVANLSGDIMLSDPILKEFFATVLSREISGDLRCYLMKFIWTIGRRYQESNRPVDFVIDLLKFEIGDLLPSMSYEEWSLLQISIYPFCISDRATGVARRKKTIHQRAQQFHQRQCLQAQYAWKGG